MNKLTTILVSMSALLLSTSTIANYKVDTLLETTTSWDEGSFYYPSGKAKIIIKKIFSDDTGKNFKNLHCHITPLAGYVIKGSVEVVKKSGQKHIFKTGDAFIQVMNQWHTGKYTKGTELIVFYTNNTQLPLNVYPGDAKQHLCK